MTERVRPLQAVNWTTGMLLAPEHMRALDARTDALVGWLMRFCLDGHGLVGAGNRVERALRGLAGLDPRVEARDEAGRVEVSVLQARGITPGGEIVDVEPDAAVSATVAREELLGSTEWRVFIVREEGSTEDLVSIGLDPANPNQPAYRKPVLRLQLGVRAETRAHALCVGQLVRTGDSVGFELDPRFIPPCLSLMAHSRLYAGWQRQQAEISLLATQCAELHRMVSAWVERVARRGVDSRADLGVREFVERAALALDQCAHDALDPGQAPERYLAAVERAGRRLALSLDLSSGTREYFQMLSDADAGYGNLLSEEREVLGHPRELRVGENLAEGLERADRTLARVRRLLEALEAKYVDFRMSRSIESLRFLLDAEGEQFFLAVASPGRPQRDADLLTFVFAQLSLAGQQRYRLVLLGDLDGVSTWQPGEEFRVDVRVNPASGVSRPISRAVQCQVQGQRNFSADFDTPREVAAIQALHVTVQPGQRIRGAILYQRRLGLGGDLGVQAPPAPEVFPPSPPAPPSPAVDRAGPAAGQPRSPIIVKKRIRTDD